MGRSAELEQRPAFVSKHDTSETKQAKQEGPKQITSETNETKQIPKQYVVSASKQKENKGSAPNEKRNKTSETKQAKQELPLYDSSLSSKDIQAFSNIQGSGEGIDITQIQRIADEAFKEAQKTKDLLSAYNACRNAYNNALRKKTKAARQMNAIRAEMRRRAIWNNYKAVVQQKKAGGTSLVRFPKSMAHELSVLRPKG